MVWLPLSLSTQRYSKVLDKLWGQGAGVPSSRPAPP